MIAYAPNVSYIFPEVPLGLRFKAVKEAGFEALEVGFLDEDKFFSLKGFQEEHGVRIVLFNHPLPVWDASHRGYLADPGLRDTFREEIARILKFAEDLKTQKVMVPVGANLEGVEREAQLECIVDNLRYAAPMAANAGVTLTIEALNPNDCPGYFLSSSYEGFEIVRRVDHPNLRFQFDTYHLRTMGEDIAVTLAENIELVGHIQFGDYPGRSEPGYGEIDFAQIDSIAESRGYKGYIGLEYVPSSPGAKALDWVPPYRKRLR